MLKKVAIILVNYKDYARMYLPACLAGLTAQDYAGELKIFIVDNKSTAESLALLKNFAPEAEIIINKNNDGFAKGNNDGMKRALEQGFDYIILFNMDTVAESDCVRKMIDAAGDEIPLTPFVKGGNIGAVQARLMLYGKKEIINSLGNVTHFLGFGYSAGYGEKYNPLIPLRGEINTLYQGENNICYPSGAAVLYKAEVLKKVGLFDEELWMYNEDQDLGWRLWLAGYKCVLAPDAVAYHKYEFSRSIKKYYYLDRNRIVAMLKNYHWATLILILPAFLVMEAGLIFFSVKNGWLKEKIKVYKYFFSLKNWRYIFESRQQAQSLRKIKDKDIIKLFSGRIWYQEIGDVKLRIANAIFNTCWKVIKVFIRW